jgi:hypothetical protein
MQVSGTRADALELQNSSLRPLVIRDRLLRTLAFGGDFCEISRTICADLTVTGMGVESKLNRTLVLEQSTLGTPISR